LLRVVRDFCERAATDEAGVPADQINHSLSTTERQQRTTTASPTQSGKKLPAAMRALRHRNYQLFFGGQLISLTGTWMQSVAESWLVYRMTGSSILLGLGSLSSQIPVFLFAPIGGAVADRHNRHRILVATQSMAMLLAFVLAVLTLTESIR